MSFSPSLSLLQKALNYHPGVSFLPFVHFIWCHEEFLNKRQIKQSVRIAAKNVFGKDKNYRHIK